MKRILHVPAIDLRVGDEVWNDTSKTFSIVERFEIDHHDCEVYVLFDNGVGEFCYPAKQFKLRMEL